MKNVPAETDFIVIGSGVAGLRATIELAAAGRVLVLAKKEITESATQYAQGGIAAALSDEDEIGLHLQDTLAAGDGLCNEEAAKVLVHEGWAAADGSTPATSLLISEHRSLGSAPDGVAWRPRVRTSRARADPALPAVPRPPGD